jgi:hypothetical protein
MGKFVRRIDVSPMHCDDITRDILVQLDGVTITDGLGRSLYLEKSDDPDNKNWLVVTDHAGRTGRVYVGIGR